MSSIRSFGLRSDIFEIAFYLFEILRLDSVAGDKVDFLIQDAFEIIAEVNDFDANRGTKFDENIHITFLLLFATRERAKHSKRFDFKDVKKFSLVG